MNLDLTVPYIPTELVPSRVEANEFTEETLALWNETVQEVLNQEYLTRQHSNAGTYDKGCRGPLCRKAYREHPRRRAPLEPGVNAPRYERVYDPILEYFHTVIKHRVKQYQLLARQTG